MTEVKVGQVWRDTHTGQQFTVTPNESFDLIDNETKWAWNAPAKDFGQDLELVKDAEPQPSDLEIVQKALDRTDASMIWTGPYASVVAGSVEVDGSIEDVLAWAKQQLGE